jgi:tetratricopeptide (TPR) repeat protein
VIRPIYAVAAALALLGTGCNTPPVPAPRGQADEARLAAAALDAGDYARAAELYRRAVAKAPDSLPLHYGLAVAASRLDLTPEAIREFRWVLERGEAGKVEVENARKWLVKVGALAPPARGSRASSTANQQPVTDRANASVEGRVVAVGGQDLGPMKRLQVFLIEQPSRVHYYQMRTDQDGRYRFPIIAPGIYKFSDRIAGLPTWRLRVEAKPGQAIHLDLGPDNGIKVRDDFPGDP